MPPYENYNATCAAVAEVCNRCGRDVRDVRIIAVSKTVGIDEIRNAAAAGSCDFGENRVDSLAEKAVAEPDYTWHMIGNIQSRRIPEIVQHADYIHSLFELRHIASVAQCAQKSGKIQRVFVQVNVSGEASKSGCAPEQALDVVRECVRHDSLQCVGLMTMAPQGAGSIIDDTFNGLRELRDEIRCELGRCDPAAAEVFSQLSMGMSEDWPQAIAAGATMVRIGRAIFSDSFAAM